MALVWTLTDTNKTTTTVNGALSLEYDRSGAAFYGSQTASTVEAECNCAQGDAVTIAFSQKSGNSETLSVDKTSLCKTPGSLPDVAWTSPGATPTLGFGTSAVGIWEHTPMSLNGVAAIGLKLKTTVKRPVFGT